MPFGLTFLKLLSTLLTSPLSVDNTWLLNGRGAGGRRWGRGEEGKEGAEEGRQGEEREGRRWEMSSSVSITVVRVTQLTK